MSMTTTTTRDPYGTYCQECDWPDEVQVGDRCPQCLEVQPEPPDDEHPEAWKGGFAANH